MHILYCSASVWLLQLYYFLFCTLYIAAIKVQSHRALQRNREKSSMRRCRAWILRESPIPVERDAVRWGFTGRSTYVDLRKLNLDKGLRFVA